MHLAQVGCRRDRLRDVGGPTESIRECSRWDDANRTAKDGRLRVRALIVLLAAERGMVAAEIAAVVRMHEATVRRWLVRYQTEGLADPKDALRPGAPPKGTRAYREQLLAVVLRRPRSLGRPRASASPSHSGRATGWPTTSPSRRASA
ncbi:MAG: hypothetical protein AMXMBFR46_23900 [Acidimicrobiia bacterium]